MGEPQAPRLWAYPSRRATRAPQRTRNKLSTCCCLLNGSMCYCTPDDNPVILRENNSSTHGLCSVSRAAARVRYDTTRARLTDALTDNLVVAESVEGVAWYTLPEERNSKSAQLSQAPKCRPKGKAIYDATHTTAVATERGIAAAAQLKHHPRPTCVGLLPQSETTPREVRQSQSALRAPSRPPRVRDRWGP